MARRLVQLKLRLLRNALHASTAAQVSFLVSTALAILVAIGTFVVLVATIRPLSMMDTWSQTCSTSSMTWLENSTVEPEAVNRVSSRRITSAETGSTPSSGSSRNSTEGLWIRAQPSMVFLRMPVE